MSEPGPEARSGHIAALRARIGTDLLLQPGVSACILDDQRRPLLARHTTDETWSFPGGAVEPLETPADAVVREAHEELGVTVIPLGVVAVAGGPACVVDYPNGDRTSYVTTVFYCRVDADMPLPDMDELVELRHVSRHEAAHLHLPPWMEVTLPLLWGWLDDGITRFTQPTRA